MRVYIEKTVLSSIATAIRKRGNTAEHLFPSEMPRAIRNIPHDIEYFRQETDVVGAHVVPIHSIGTLEQRYSIPVLEVKNREEG
jgi:hypothetical protein